MPFRTIVGHRRTVSLLSRAVARGTLPPSLLFAGPAGVGKRRTAVAIAEAVNCLQPRSSAEFEHDACGECAVCRRIARGTHQDIIVVEPGETGNIRIEQARDVIDRAGYRPFEARRRVAIFDDAEALVAPAQNALLKTLEEPPSASIFILVSSTPDALLPTVLSRCPRLRFGPLSPAEVAGVLMRDHDYDEAEARAAAADADGSVGRALSAGSADAAQARESARQLLEHTAQVADPVRRIDGVRNLTGARSSAAEEREQLAVCLRALASLIRDIGALGARADVRTLANVDLEPQLARLAQRYDSERSLRAYAAIDRALEALRGNASPKVVADWLVLQL